MVGASVAGVRTAQALRRLDADLPIVLLDAESHPPYDRPPLSKGFLTEGAEAVCLMTPAELERANVDMRLGVRVVALDPQRRQVRLDTGEALAYRRLVVATGALARTPPWSGVDGIVTLRGLDDARTLRDQLRKARRVVVIGAGFIGSEVAAAARRMGVEVALVDLALVPLERLLGAELGALLARVHAVHGTSTYFGRSVSAVSQSIEGYRVQLSDGTVLTGDVLVAGLGAVPNAGWLASGGVDVTDGVLCDANCRAVGVPDVYAVGDVARWMHPGRGSLVRVEHWTNAVEQARYVARQIVAPHDRAPYAPEFFVWSDQYDWKIQILGWPRADAEPVVVGESGGDHPRFAALVPDGNGGLACAVTVNWAKAGLVARSALKTGELVADVADRLRSAAP